MKHPVVYLFFNRPNYIRHSFKKIQEYKPDKLHLVCDGPRNHRDEDKDAVRLSREIIDEMTNWPCHLVFHYSSKNLGCGLRISSALNEVFKLEDTAIVVEDDCVVGDDFFKYMGEGLDYYREKREVMLLAGVPLLRRAGLHSYRLGKTPRFTRYWSPWGWATWKRFWENYDFEMTGLEDWLTSGGIREIVTSKFEQERLSRCLREVASGKFDTWDYQVYFALWRLGGYCVEPPLNLVRNIGYGGSATHTIGNADPQAFRSPRKITKIDFPPQVTAQELLEGDHAIGEWYRLGPSVPARILALGRGIYWRKVLNLI